MSERKIRGGERGQALVEAALVLPIIMIIIMGIMEFGRIFGGYLVLTNASREGARYGVIYHDNPGIIAAAKTACIGFDPAQVLVTVSPDEAERRKGDELRVRVESSVDLATPLLGAILPDPFPLNTEAVMRVE